MTKTDSTLDDPTREGAKAKYQHAAMSRGALDAIREFAGDDVVLRFALQAAYAVRCSGREKGMPISTAGAPSLVKRFGMPRRMAVKMLDLLHQIAHPDGQPLTEPTAVYNANNQTAYFPKVGVFETTITHLHGDEFSVPSRLINDPAVICRVIGASPQQDRRHYVETSVRAARFDTLLRLQAAVTPRWWGVDPAVAHVSWGPDDLGMSDDIWCYEDLLEYSVEVAPDYDAVRHLLQCGQAFSLLLVAAGKTGPLYPVWTAHGSLKRAINPVLDRLRDQAGIYPTVAGLPFATIGGPAVGILMPVQWATVAEREAVHRDITAALARVPAESGDESW